jgi:UDP-N-acetyl-D-mannosaminuronic acid dehydrogenase
VSVNEFGFMTRQDVSSKHTNPLEDTTIALFGLGKMGLPLAAVFADHGATVHGVDVDSAVVTAVSNGTSPVDGEPGLDELVGTYGGDTLLATTDGTEAASKASIAIVIVPTLVDGETPDLSAILAAGEEISSGIDQGDLVILESTVPPGTTNGVFRSAVEPDHLDAGEDFDLAFCPERTASGSALTDITESYPKIVGGTTEHATQRAGALYKDVNQCGVIEMDGATAAEAVKVYEGIYRDINIALANELAGLSEGYGIDAWSVFEAANTQPYCDIHRPGIGVGGHCIPVYPHFVMEESSDTPLIETARSINDDMPARTANRLLSMLADEDVDHADARVLVLGITYRAGVAETRFAPAIETIDSLLEAGVTVFAHDPLLEKGAIATTGAKPADDPTSITDLDALVLATGHDEYRNLDLDRMREDMRHPILVDGRNFFDRESTSGFREWTIGRRERPAQV